MSSFDSLECDIEIIDDADKSSSLYLTEDSNNEFKTEFEKMPLCSEKILLRLIYFFSLKKENIPKDYDWKNEINLLDERLEIESILKKKDKIHYEHLKASFKEDPKEILNNAIKLLHSLRDLNIQELLSLTKSNNEAIRKIKDKNVFLLFGPTGAGKSTTLHFLGGSKMEKQLLDGKMHIVPKEITNEDLKSVKTGLSAIKSETRLVIPVKIPVDKDEFGFDHVMFCDLPGFGDTNGPEIDIANSIAIDECIKVCSGIKPIVFISYKFGDRLQLLTKLTQTLNGMFITTSRVRLNFSFIFSLNIPMKKVN
jgi:hypothetical protein